MLSVSSVTPWCKVMTRKRLISSGIQLFAEKGYEKVSIREICKHAETSINMIHHYFGSKEELFASIVNQFTEDVFAYPTRLLEKEIKSEESVVGMFELFFEETLLALIDNKQVVQIIVKHEISSPVMANLNSKFVKFLEQAQRKGFVNKEIEPALVSGILMDRLGNQIIYADRIFNKTKFDIIGNRKHRSKWIESNLQLLLYGLVVR